MKIINLTLKQAIICFILFLLFSCQKKNFDKNELKTSEIETAKSWFEKQPHAVYLVNWDKAIYNSETNRVIAPLVWNVLLDDGRLVTRKLSISGSQTKQRAAKIVEIVPAGAYFKTHRTQFSSKSFEGSLAVLDLNLKVQYGYYRSGEIRYPVTYLSYSSREEYEQTPKSEDCYYTQYTYIVNGIVVVTGVKYCTAGSGTGSGGSSCGCGGGEPEKPIEWEIDEGTNPENGAPGEFHYAHIDEVIDSLHTPCFKNTLAQIVNGAFSGTIVDVINRVFGFNETLSVTVMEDQLSPDLGGTTQSAKSGMYIKSNIVLNQTIATASKEYVAAVILHEAIHAYFDAKNTWPLKNANNVQHNAMTNEYVSAMASALQHLFPNLSSQDAVNLAWGGLQETLSWQNMVLNDPAKINSIINTNVNHRAGTTGTICN